MYKITEKPIAKLPKNVIRATHYMHVVHSNSFTHPTCVFKSGKSLQNSCRLMTWGNNYSIEDVANQPGIQFVWLGLWSDSPGKPLRDKFEAVL